MGQYYHAYVKDADGERVYCPQNAIFLTLKGLESASQITDEIKRGGGYWDHFSGLKLTEHSWMRNDFCNGVLEQVWDHPAQVAWVGDYATDEHDFNGNYTKRVHKYVWSGPHVEVPFDQIPHLHMAGWLVNRTKVVYLDLAEYVAVSSYSPKWDKSSVWCVNPLPILTCIGNGRGGGDYVGTNMDKVGSWAMDVIEYTLDRDGLGEVKMLAACDYRFVED